jgi:hypothetical protein
MKLQATAINATAWGACQCVPIFWRQKYFVCMAALELARLGALILLGGLRHQSCRLLAI